MKSVYFDTSIKMKGARSWPEPTRKPFSQ